MRPERATVWRYHMEVAKRMAELARFIRDESPYAANVHPRPTHYQDAASYHYMVARRLRGIQ